MYTLYGFRSLTPLSCAPSKTPEELALENESLRSSLDALASHAQTLKQANKALKQAGDEREKMMRSVVVGVRREVRPHPPSIERF